MTVAKISGLNTVLTDTIIKNGMGFGIADRSSWLGIFKGSLPSRTDAIGDAEAHAVLDDRVSENSIQATDFCDCHVILTGRK
jgi:hypothetical protein